MRKQGLPTAEYVLVLLLYKAVAVAIESGQRHFQSVLETRQSGHSLPIKNMSVTSTLHALLETFAIGVLRN